MRLSLVTQLMREIITFHSVDACDCHLSLSVSPTTHSKLSPFCLLTSLYRICPFPSTSCLALRVGCYECQSRPSRQTLKLQTWKPLSPRSLCYLPTPQLKLRQKDRRYGRVFFTLIVSCKDNAVPTCSALLSSSVHALTTVGSPLPSHCHD